MFDPATVRGNATIENPNQVASGIDLVLVNGKTGYRKGEFMARSGAAIRY